MSYQTIQKPQLTALLQERIEKSPVIRRELARRMFVGEEAVRISAKKGGFSIASNYFAIMYFKKYLHLKEEEIISFPA